uniref:Uncharacterized protein n=1 Tax=Physcomitrium patens TaxID=3218 RepID=A0A2K1KLA4_PHYPA|nr:hypothetical protein PHYPA_008234 [Physcomitrium patens]
MLLELAAETSRERSGAVQINIRACIYSWIAQVWFLWVRSNKGGGGITSTVGEGGLSALSGRDCLWKRQYTSRSWVIVGTASRSFRIAMSGSGASKGDHTILTSSSF